MNAVFYENRYRETLGSAQQFCACLDAQNLSIEIYFLYSTILYVCKKQLNSMMLTPRYLRPMKCRKITFASLVHLKRKRNVTVIINK